MAVPSPEKLTMVAGGQEPLIQWSASETAPLMDGAARQHRTVLADNADAEPPAARANSFCPPYSVQSRWALALLVLLTCGVKCASELPPAPPPPWEVTALRAWKALALVWSPILMWLVLIDPGAQALGATSGGGSDEAPPQVVHCQHGCAVASLPPDEALQEVPQMRGGLRPPLPLAEYLRWFPQLSALGRLRGAALRVERAGLRYQLERFDSRIACAEPSARCGAPARGVAHRLGYRLHRDVAALAPGLAPLPLLPRFDNDRVDHKRFGADLRERGGAIRLREALRALRTFRGSRWEAERWTWGPARALPSGAAEGRAAIRAQKMEPWRLAHVGQLGPRCAPRLIDDWPQKDLRQAAQPFALDTLDEHFDTTVELGDSIAKRRLSLPPHLDREEFMGRPIRSPTL
eukprot:CAMPEP_0117546156 /NCGR_PEP_ID=MMETSP0784-20121206/46464_1 /TAXON_ID=39447 /ORGANISM="" /LENGTH=405 /DNA_ID=CAMNT_0005343023 /DNA_START=45 /DNA_END=1262 /DNA_ORIENTATION=+